MISLIFIFIKICKLILFTAEAFPPVPIGGGIKPKIAGTVAALDPRLGE